MQFNRLLPHDVWLDRGLAFLRVCFVYQQGTKWAKSWATFMLLSYFSGFALLCYSIYFSLNNVNNLAHMVHYALIMLTNSVGILNYKRPHIQTKLNQFVTALRHTFDYGSWMNYEEVNRLQRHRAIWHKRMVIGLYVAVVYHMIGFIMFGFVNKINTGSFIFFPCKVPINIESPLNYYVFLAYQTMMMVFILLGVFGVISHYYHIYYYFDVELLGLSSALQQLKQKEHGFSYKAAIRECVIHHQQIIHVFETSQSIVGTINFLILTSGVATMSIAGIALVAGDIQTKFLFFILMVTELAYFFIVCFYCQHIIDLSSKVNEVCYDTNWWLMDKNSTSSIQIMIERSFKPLTYKSISGHTLSLQMYMTMVKSAYSYFNLVYANNAQ